jgi:hypothetical protein
MRILFINSNSYDYLQDIVYSGLVKLLGSSNVVHWPVNYKYIFPFKKYPKNLGFHPASWRGASIGTPNPVKFDAVIVASSKPATLKAYLRIASQIPPATPVVYLDGGDREVIGGDLERLGRADLFNESRNTRDFNWIFKREYFEDKTYAPNVRPLPFGFNFSRVPNNPLTVKKYEVTFWAVESHPIRTQALSLLQNEFDCTSNGTTLNQSFKKYKRKGKHYLEELASGKIALNFRGGGWDTLRYWEIPAVTCFMISQKPAVYIPNNFEHGKHVIFCNDDLSDLLDLCAYYLKNEKQRIKIETAGHNHARQYHSDISRATAILSLLRPGHSARQSY